MEPLIGYLKTEHRLGENNRMGTPSPTMKASWAATGWPWKTFMEPRVQAILFYFFRRASLVAQSTLIITKKLTITAKKEFLRSHYLYA